MPQNTLYLGVNNRELTRDRDSTSITLKSKRSTIPYRIVKLVLLEAIRLTNAFWVTLNSHHIVEKISGISELVHFVSRSKISVKYFGNGE